jgi:uncharacterized membrane protein
MSTRDQIDVILLVAGMILSIVLVFLIFRGTRRIYVVWAKLTSILACIAALGWGALGLFLLHPPASIPRHILSALTQTKGTLGGICLGFVLSILIARPYQKVAKSPKNGLTK